MWHCRTKAQDVQYQVQGPFCQMTTIWAGWAPLCQYIHKITTKASLRCWTPWLVLSLTQYWTVNHLATSCPHAVTHKVGIICPLFSSLECHEALEWSYRKLRKMPTLHSILALCISPSGHLPQKESNTMWSLDTLCSPHSVPFLPLTDHHQTFTQGSLSSLRKPATPIPQSPDQQMSKAFSQDLSYPMLHVKKLSLLNVKACPETESD